MERIKNVLWDERSLIEKIIGVTIVFSTILAMVYLWGIPAAVGIKYKWYRTAGNIYVWLVVLACVCSAVKWAYKVISQRKDYTKRIFFVVLLIVTLAISNVFGLWKGIFSIPSKEEYTAVNEMAENIKSSESLYNQANSFSWYKESWTHRAKFETKSGVLEVTYDNAFEVVEKSWIDSTPPALWLFHLIVALSIVLSTHLTLLASKLYVKVRKAAKKRKITQNKGYKGEEDTNADTEAKH